MNVESSVESWEGTLKLRNVDRKQKVSKSFSKCHSSSTAVTNKGMQVQGVGAFGKRGARRGVRGAAGDASQAFRAETVGARGVRLCMDGRQG